MKIRLFIILSICLLGCNCSWGQEDSTTTEKTFSNRLKKVPEYDPLAPSKAAFYSAVLPGLGQAYNRSYWKIPIIYAGIGASIYAYIYNDQQFDSYRDAYKRRLAGFEDDEYQGQISDEGLIQAQKQFRRNKEISLIVAVGIYILNIVDANVQAHLRQFNVSENLSVRPGYRYDQFTGDSQYGVQLNFKF